MLLRRTILVLLFLSGFAGWQSMLRAQPSADAGNTLVAFLSQSIEWYHHVQLSAEADGSDSVYAAYHRRASVQALSLIFDFARSAAQQIQLEHTQPAPGGESGKDAPTSLSQLVNNAQDKVRQANTDLATLEQQAGSATGKKRQTLDDQVAEQKSEVELAEARLEALESMSTFATSGTSAGLPGKVAELERTVPEALALRSTERAPRNRQVESTTASNTASPATASSGQSSSSEGAASGGGDAAASSSPPATPAQALTAPPSTAVTPATSPAHAPGILSLSSDLIALTGKISAERAAQAETTKLRAALEHLRDPLRRQLKEVNQRGDDLAAQPQSSDPSVLADRRKQIQQLTADFRRLSAILLPLAKASLLLDATANNLAEWRAESERASALAGRGLLLRVFLLLGAILAVAIAGDFWRRAIFRYIQEQRRRNQFLLLRRIVVTFLVVLIFVFGLSSELGSLATFAGFLTAGIAVALQNVILSVAAYFFLIGRYGIRVGDRVQIGSVTGDVVDIGLIRLHLVELDTTGGEARPTGRVVVFSNSVVFQPTSNFFKQLPGSNFAWRRITLTLAPEVDYILAQKRISAAVASVYAGYRLELEHQHRMLERSLTIPIAAPEPQTRLRLDTTGLEIVILYPVELSQAAAIDDRMTQALLEAIASEPGLRLVGAGLTGLRAEDATPPAPPLPLKN